MADRFYTPEPLGVGDFILDGPEAHHLAHVRRLSEADHVVLFNGDGHEYLATILSVEKKQVEFHITSKEKPERELGFRLQIASALPKGDRGDFLIEKLTELGVTDFTPLITERSVVHPKETKVEKLQRAVIEASKQCGRNVLLRVHAPSRLTEWLKIGDLPTRKWLAHPGGEKPQHRAAEDLAIAIGPEGGFSVEEVAAACTAGFEVVTLGPRILRVETAALALVAKLA
ncbi:MAG: 16S rRNA (uracil(1498)-N(3))-methyltransferase [Planctomycetes bacterium]|nr:16S rRNA (uracil(1498)-N(3))-methyltransferase [Planctomycetota bacterium]